MIALRGLAAVLFGILALVWPGLTLGALVLLYGAYALVDGVLAIIVVLRGETPHRITMALGGVVGVLAGVIAFAYPGLAALVLLYIMAAWAILTAVLQIMGAVRRRQARRQDRGVRRIEAVLDAAEAVFAEAGYEGATASAIATRARISQGSLYQFFGGKEVLARALGERYVVSLRLLHEAGLATATGVPLATFVSGFVDPIVEFNRAHPALMKLFGASQAPPGLHTVIDGIRRELLERLDRAFAARQPRLGAKGRSRMVTVTLQMGLALLPLTLDADRATADAFAAELKAAICAYWSAAGEA